MERVSFAEAGKICGAAGVQGYFGEGYSFHTITRPNFDGIGFGSKTFSVEERLGKEPEKGNAELLDDGVTLREIFPSCVKLSGFSHMLNAFGLSNCSLKKALEMNRLQQRTKAFRLSVMVLGKTFSAREDEYREIVSLLKFYLPKFRAPVILQENKSCPNVAKNAGADPFAIPHYDPLDENFVFETKQNIRTISALPVRHEIKYSVTTSPKTVFLIHEEFKGEVWICVSNTVAFGRFSKRIPWEKLFGKISPLAHLGGGGLSGPYLLELVLDWLWSYRELDKETPINAGGGIFTPQDVLRFVPYKPLSVFVGTVATLRPWRLPSIVKMANEVL